MKSAYDIFISYRRKDAQGSDKGVHIARTIKQYLEIKGYKGRVFFDYSELSNEDFDKRILSVIRQAKVFISVLTPDSMLRCVNDGDWVRRELMEAYNNKLQMIFINPDGREIAFPGGFPEELSFVKTRNHLTVHMDSSFERDMDDLIEKHIAPVSAPSDGSKSGKYAKVRVRTDHDCIIKRFDEEIGSAKVGEYSIVYLPKGKHRITFMANDAEAAALGVSITQIFEVKDIDYEDYIEVSLKDVYDKRLKDLAISKDVESAAKKKKGFQELIDEGQVAMIRDNQLRDKRIKKCNYMSERVFISYKRVDKDRVFAIKDFIERGLGGDVDGKNYCWIDLEGIESDSQFANVIFRAINRADIFLFMYSSAHSEIVNFENDWTLKEINFAQMKEKRIVFVNIDGSALSDWYALLFGTKLQQVDGTDEEALLRLCNDMRKWLGLSTESKAVSAAGGKGIGSSTKADSGVALKVTKSIINGHEYVDLGLPSGLKWATCNVGASSSEEYGDYYAWGEVETTSEYTDDNSKTYDRRMSDISGNSTYDVARAKWGGSWRLPTEKELEELKNNCKWEWTTQNGKKGYKVTGSNGNSIFLPAAGYRNRSSFSNAGESGYYWSSTPLNSNDYGAYYLYFYSSDRIVGWGIRFNGQSVRPVSE